MNIVIDQQLIDGYRQALSQSLELLTKAQQQVMTLQQMAEENRLLSIPSACAYLDGISEQTLHYYRRLGLEPYKKGKDGVWFRKGDIDAWLQSGKVSRRMR